MAKRRKGFTIVELIVTIGVVGIFSAMAALAVSALVRIQGEISTASASNQDVDNASKKIRETISFLSVKNDACEFAYSFCDGSSVIFVNTVDSASYTLHYFDKVLSFSNTYTDSNNYLKFNYSETYPHLKGVVFSYDDSLQLLKAVITSEGSPEVAHVYPLEVLR